MTTLSIRNLVSWSPLWHGLLLIPLALVCFGLSPTAQAVTPAPDGGYPGGNTAEGTAALFSLTTGLHNTAIGFHALYSEKTGNGNTATGKEALYYNSTGDANTATGYSALSANTTGIENTANGVAALQQNTTGNHNTATGVHALLNNTTADENTANGYGTLESNTIGVHNTATGFQALFSNTTGGENEAYGYLALFGNTTGDANAAYGSFALSSNTTGHRNTATGGSSLPANTTGFRNTGTGFATLFNNSTGNLNTATGWSSLFNNSTGSFNIALGYKAGENITTGDNNIDVGNMGGAGEANTIRIGNQVAVTDSVGFPHPVHTATYIAGISGTTVAKSVAVFIDANGQLGTKASSERFKDEIKPMDKTSEAILALKPVTFHYKKELDPDGTPQFGLIAEDVAKVNPDLVVRDAEGKVYTVRYDAVNAMMLNEFHKEHRTVQEQGTTVAELKKQISTLIATVKEQASQIQKVSAQIEVTNPAPQTVLNNQ
jgi:hypothetical protein